MARNEQFGTLVTNSFRTLTGGTLYYDYRNIFKCNEINKNISIFKKRIYLTKYKSIISYRTIIWLGEEIHQS
jgi:hypothetical protein